MGTTINEIKLPGFAQSNIASTFQVNTLVRPSDIDGMGHVNNAKALGFFELGRVQWVSQVGIDLPSWIVPVLTRANIVYKKELNMRPILIETRLTAAKYYTAYFEQKVIIDNSQDNGEKHVCVYGDLEVNFISGKTRRPVKISALFD